MRAKYTWLAVSLVASAAVSVIEARIIWFLHGELASVRLRYSQLESQEAQAMRRNNAMNRDIRQAGAELSELAELGRGVGLQNPEIASWLARAKRLKEAFEKNADQRIPEMGLLKDSDWALLSRSASLDTEDGMRRAMADVRSAGKRAFAGMIGKALASYSKDNDGKPPPNISALTQYLSDPAYSDALQRYQVGTDGDNSSGVKVKITEAGAVDTDFDTRLEVFDNGGLAEFAAPMAWIPGFNERQNRAYQAYFRENSQLTQPTTATLLRYFDPPLDPDTATKVLQRMEELKH